MIPISTPSKHRLASRSQSHNPDSAVSTFKSDLTIDVGRSQICDLDDLLKFTLSSILRQDSDEKLALDDYQKRIEQLERDLDTHTRADDAAEQQKHKIKNAMNQAEGGTTLGEGSSQSDREVALGQDELHNFRADRQKILDRLLDQCLANVLRFCEDMELRRYLTEYSKAKVEADFYAPFVNGCNRALECMDNISLDMFRPTSSLNCRFHKSDKLVVKNDYSDSPVYIKPDVIITSTVALEDLHYQPDDPSVPKRSLQMRQILCCSEFKRENKSFTLPLEVYDEKRRSEYPCTGKLSALASPDESGRTVETGERPPKQRRLDMSQSTKNTSATRPALSKTRRGSRNMSQTKGSRGRGSQRGSHRGTGSNNETTRYLSNNSKKMVDAETQCAMYGMEMLSYAIGVHHAMTMLIIDCKLWVWYYDRQGIIQSNGIDFVQDLPRFLVLLFAFQRFNLADWGVIAELNPGAMLAHDATLNATNPDESSSRVQVSNEGWLKRGQEPKTCILKTESLDAVVFGSLANEDLEEIYIDLEDWLSHKPHSIAGRATAVVGSSNPKDATRGKLACKISFPEVARENEGVIIGKLRQDIEADRETQHFSKHLPEVLMYGDMSRYGTQRIRSMLKICITGYRTLRALVSGKLAPLTSLVGADLVKSWLEVVRFHAFLWSRGFEHGDPSLWNVMYNEGRTCGVLGDYDLSISQRQPRVPGTDRTGTIPFMAVDLLNDEYWHGEIERLYRHEFEAFIWILPFVFLRYQNGRSQPGTLVERWMTSDYTTCAERKNYFRDPDRLGKQGAQCQANFKDHWVLAEHLLLWWSEWLNTIKFAPFRRYSEFDQTPGLGRASRSEEDSSSVVSIWPSFIAYLRQAARAFPSIGYIDNLIDELDLERPFWVQHPAP